VSSLATSPVLSALGIGGPELLRELSTPHDHDFSLHWGQPLRCGCGGWEDLVAALEAVGLPARRMSMDPLLRQALAVSRALPDFGRQASTRGAPPPKAEVT
jgi:hypothetical protein